MSWRLEINHLTRYRYDRPVVASYNEARLTPLLDLGAIRDRSSGRRQARPAQLFCFTDYWGSVVHAFDIHNPHQTLLVTSRAVVETVPAGPSRWAEGEIDASVVEVASWEALAEADVGDRFYEFLAPSTFVTPEDSFESGQRSSQRSRRSC